MIFPCNDTYWQEILDFLNKEKLEYHSTIAHEAFLDQLDNAVSYEWSYWKDIASFEVIVLHKDMLMRFKNNWLESLDKQHQYVFGNPVFNVFVKQPGVIEVCAHSLQHRMQLTCKEALVEKSISGNAACDQYKIMLVTAGNSGNLGDDVIAIAASNLISKQYPDAIINHVKAPADKLAIQNHDLVVLGGGGVFYDTCFANAINYCQFFLYAKELDVPICGIGIGAHGILSERGIELFSHCLNVAEFIMVRDPKSRNILIKRLGLNCPVLVRQDTAMSLPLSSNKEFQWCKKTKKPVLMFSLLDSNVMRLGTKVTSYRGAIADCVAYLTQYFEVVLIVQSRDDLQLYSELRKTFGCEIFELDFEQAHNSIALYQHADLVLTSRLHGFLLAVLAGVPVIPVTGKRGKLGGMILYAFPSMDETRLLMADFSLNALKDKIHAYMAHPDDFIARSEEVELSREMSKHMGVELKKMIGDY